MYRISSLSKRSDVLHALSTKVEGDMSFDFTEKDMVIANRGDFLSKAGIDMGMCVTFTVKHGNRFIEIGTKDGGLGMKDWKEAPECDGLITREAGVYLFLKVADCIPLILYDVQNGILSLVHIGWKNVQNKIVVNILKYCKDRYGTSCKNLLIFIGPSVRKDSYIKENPSQLQDPEWNDFLSKISGNSYKVDIVGALIRQLLDLGVHKRNITDCKIDTALDGRFYSYVRDGGKLGSTGRFACVVGMTTRSGARR